MATAGALGVIGVDRAALERPQSVLDETRFVQRVRMNGYLHVQFVGDTSRQVSMAAGVVPQSS